MIRFDEIRIKTYKTGPFSSKPASNKATPNGLLYSISIRTNY